MGRLKEEEEEEEEEERNPFQVGLRKQHVQVVRL